MYKMLLITQIHSNYKFKTYYASGGRRDEVWDRETMFSQLAKKQEANRQRKSEMLKKLKNIISCIFVFLAYRICLSVLKLLGETVLA